MSNYLDNVPIKIAEKYKPPPKNPYQLPQAIANRLTLATDHYHTAPQHTYDFQLERKVLTKIPEWRRMRQQERDARRERKQKREQEKLRELETQQKKLLGAVKYPSTEDLSSSESEAEQNAHEEDVGEQKHEETVASIQANNFNNILQPTILPYLAESIAAKGTGIRTCNDNIFSTGNHANTFNYKDFEEDTSSPFDNVELKSINDLDILAQVLHNTQVKEEQQIASKVAESKKDEAKENNATVVIEKEQIDNSNLAAATKAESYSKANQPQHNESIPRVQDSYGYVYQDVNSGPFINHHTAYIPFNPQPNGQEQQQHYANYNYHAAAYSNHNYLDNSCLPYGGVNTSSAYYSPTYRGALETGCNANTYITPVHFKPSFNCPPAVLPTHTRIMEEAQGNMKSKSVPDILKELSVEVRNSEMRRSRNYSYNMQEEDKAPEKAHVTPPELAMKEALQKPASRYYSELEVHAQKMAKNISSMGFPLERVAKIVKLVGADDKKIIEHLIPLSELMDLGFDETEISEALVKFDNNKEKALEYLIS